MEFDYVVVGAGSAGCAVANRLSQCGNYLVALIVAEKSTNKQEIKKFIENINKNLSLIEKIKKFLIIFNEFTIENRMLTPTLKLKRKIILENYKKHLENLY